MASFYFLSWQVFTSSVGKFSLPQLASFCFLSWQVFASSVGVFLLPQLANAEKNAIGAKIANKEFKAQIQNYFRNFS
ncbi:MAG: hypothetical protein SOR86_03780 [Sodaliphilus sp.]|nr:hypothetical protein [Sodaliphilus sp.]